MPKTPTTRAALYARLSVTKDESVSISRQLESARKYAEAQGWAVVLEEFDEGVSATRNRPEQRAGWRAVMARADDIDVVVVWKIDRLARRVIDFLQVAERLEEKEVSLAAVRDKIDLTSANGQAYATMMAVFGQLEASAMSERATAARAALLKAGRRAGGKPPYGWMNVSNPDGPGMVLAQDPDRIGVVSAMVEMALAGTSIYGIRRWLEHEGVQPRARRGAVGEWYDATVEGILRNPVLAGMVPFAQGRKPGADADPTAVLRDELGVPIVDESISIITTEERRNLLAVLDEAKRPGSRPRSDTEPFLLHGLVRCASCDGPMYRGTTGKGYRQLRCQRNSCSQQVTAMQESVERAVEEEFLRVKGDDLAIRLAEVRRPQPARVGDIQQAINALTAELAGFGPEDPEALDRLRELKARRDEALAESEQPSRRTWTYESRTNRDAWEAATEVEERRRLLLGCLDRVTITRSDRRGPKFDPSRLTYDWAVAPDAGAVQVTPLLPRARSRAARR